MHVYPVSTAQIDDFIDLARTLHGGDPAWVPPLRQVELKRLSGGSSFSRTGRMRLFACESGGRTVGRIAALLEPRLRSPEGTAVGQVGYFESVNDVHVAHGLFKAAFAWLRAEGADTIWGPMNGGVHFPHRMMTSGFEREPFILEPRNPRYYPALFERFGFRTIYRWYSYEVSAGELRTFVDPLGAVAARAARRYACEWIDPSDSEAVMGRLHRLTNAVWDEHIGFVPLSLESCSEAYRGVLPLLENRNLMVITDRAGEDVGIGLMYPDYVNEARALQGDASGWGSWCEGDRPDRVVMYSLAVIPRVRGTGAPLVLFERGARRALDAGYRRYLFAIVSQDFRQFLDRMAVPTREYALYERPIELG